MLGVYAMLHVAAVIISAALDLESEAALVFEPEKGQNQLHWDTGTVIEFPQFIIPRFFHVPIYHLI